jgi:hypothetical protein
MKKIVMPAKAGFRKARKDWIPACAGMPNRDLMMKRRDFEIDSNENDQILKYQL